jgi:dienelactone hydrolase
MSDDRVLLRDYARPSSESAFADLLWRHIDLVYSTALRGAAGDEQLARDVSQTECTRIGTVGRKTNRLEASMKLIFRNSPWIFPSACMALSLMGAMALPCAAPVNEGPSSGAAVSVRATTQSPLPAPTGPYEVERTEFDWVDTSRPDPDSPSGHREIVVWLWYPAAPKDGAEAAEWMPGKWGELLLRNYLSKKSSGTNLSEIETRLKEQPLSTIRTHAYPDAPLLPGKKKFPVLLFEPGFGMLPFFYAALIEDLASHGYIVAGIIPTYYTYYNVFSNGRVTDTYISTHTNAHLPDWTGDMIFTLNQLEKLDADDKSKSHERQDFLRVGAFGHSFGGAASVQVARDDPRVRAALDLDGTLAGDVIDRGLLKPFLTFDHPHPGESNYHRDAVVLRDAKPAYRLTLAGSQHGFSQDWGLLPFIPTSAKKAALGTIDPSRALTITKAYVRAFFGEYLEGRKSLLLNGPSPEYPEITFETNQK